MTGAPLSARARANRANAAKSTGPRTREGKARVARNAVTHGLAAIQPEPASGKVCALAEAFLQGLTVVRTPTLTALAVDFAQAQLHVLAVRAIRRGYWERVAASEPECAGPVDLAAGQRLPRKLSRMIEAAARRDARRSEPLKNIEALERYERQALARRKWAARAFSEAVTVLEAERAPLSDGHI